jgi:hypothetical protein
MAAIEVELNNIADFCGNTVRGEHVTGRANVNGDDIGEGAGSKSQERSSFQLNHCEQD